MDTVTIMLLARRNGSNKWQNTGEFKLPALPRIGDHVVIDNYTENVAAYLVVGIFHPAPNKGLIDVLAIYDGKPADVQNRLISL